MSDNGIQATMDLGERRQAEHKIAESRRKARNERKKRSDVRPFGDRFWERVSKVESGCWNWTAGVVGEGYGSVTYDGVKFLTHRVAYELLVGLVPAGRDLHHLCENRRCVNPAHLELLTRKEHARRHAGETCRFGHPYGLRPNGTRECVVCRKLRQKENNAKRNQQARERRRRAKEAAA